MNDQLTLQALCTLLMRDDPSSLAPVARERIEKWTDKKSQELGFDNWIDAYHWNPDSEDRPATLVPARETCGESPPVPPSLSDISPLPPVLDVCCGSRMFWFDKKDERALFVDKRRETHPIDIGTPGTIGRSPIVVDPDILADFRQLPFPEDSFSLVVFDPPHIERTAAKGLLTKKYGHLVGDWREMLRAGFAECFRVLKPGGTLIFKWAESDHPVSEILKLTPHRPLFGHRSGKSSATHWIAFLKSQREGIETISGGPPPRAEDSDQGLARIQRDEWKVIADMEYALSLMEERDPDFKAPPEWLADKPVSVEPDSGRRAEAVTAIDRAIEECIITNDLTMTDSDPN